MKIMDKMKNIVLLFFVLIPFFGIGQKSETFAEVNIDTVLTSRNWQDTLIVYLPDSTGQYQFKSMANPVDELDGVNLRYFNSIIDTLTIAGGSDSLLFDSSTGYLFDYRAGVKYDSTLIKYTDFYLEYGATRTISIDDADTGDGNNLIIKAGDDDDNIGGGDLYLKGGGSLTEFGNIYIGVGDSLSSIYLKDTIRVDTVQIKGVAPGTDSLDVVVVSQLSDFRKSVYTISLPAGSGISDRLAGSYTAPDGWVLTAGSNDIDLEIEHNTGRRVVNCSVFSNLSGVEQLLVNSAGFTSIVTPDVNNATIGSLATQIVTPIKVYLILE